VTSSHVHFGKIFNIGTHNEFSVLEIFEKVTRALKMDGRFIHVNNRPHNDKRYCVDTTTLEELGWKEETTFDEALEHTTRWYREHPDWYN
jgi:dTDP-D-glucose 4,6-dehydratase